jgi:hypothetical protein
MARKSREDWRAASRSKLDGRGLPPPPQGHVRARRRHGQSQPRISCRGRRLGRRQGWGASGRWRGGALSQLVGQERALGSTAATKGPPRSGPSAVGSQTLTSGPLGVEQEVTRCWASEDGARGFEACSTEARYGPSVSVRLKCCALTSELRKAHFLDIYSASSTAASSRRRR